MKSETTANPVTMAKVLEEFDITYRGDGDFFETSIIIDGPMSEEDITTFIFREESKCEKAFELLCVCYKDAQFPPGLSREFVTSIHNAVMLLRQDGGDPLHLQYLNAEEDEMGYKDVVVINVVIAALRERGKQRMSYRINTQAAKIIGDDIATCIDGPTIMLFLPSDPTKAATIAPTTNTIH